MKFGVSASRIRVKIIQTKKQCISCSALCSSPAIPATVLVGASSTRRPSMILARRAARPYPVAVPSPSFPLPSSSPSSSSRVAQRRARAVVVRRTGRSSPPRLDSSRPEPRRLAVHPLRPPTSATEPFTGRNQALRPPLAIAVHDELRPLRRRPSSGPPPPQIDPR